MAENFVEAWLEISSKTTIIERAIGCSHSRWRGKSSINVGNFGSSSQEITDPLPKKLRILVPRNMYDTGSSSQEIPDPRPKKLRILVQRNYRSSSQEITYPRPKKLRILVPRNYQSSSVPRNYQSSSVPRNYVSSSQEITDPPAFQSRISSQ